MSEKEQSQSSTSTAVATVVYVAALLAVIAFLWSSAASFLAAG